MIASTHHGMHKARGTTLIISIVLLLLLALIGLFATTVGLREQRASGAELRERIVRQAAESGLSHAMEYVRGASLVPALPGGEVNLTVWEPCQATDTSFPCGTVSPGVANDPTRRGRMYRYAGGVDLDGVGGIDARERYMIPLPTNANGSRQIMTQIGDFPVRYGVAAVLCTFAADASCTRTDAERTGLGTVTLASWAQLPDENTRVTLTESYGSFRILNVPPNAPPLVAGGLLQGVGNMTVVANPNSGGTGVPVSLWSRGPTDVNNGSWQTCNLDEYMRQGPATYSGDTKVLTCVDCECVSEDRVSGAHGQGGRPTIGLDVQTPRPAGGVNDRDEYWSGDILPSTFFPCDMFEYVFGVRAREDTNLNGTSNPDAPYPICENGTDSDNDGHLDAAKAFLDSNAEVIAGCGALDAESAGLYWVTGACTTSGDQIGSPDHPVVIVSSGDIKLGGATLYGIIFGFNTRNIDLIEGDLDGMTPELDPGGGKSKVYGAIMVEGSIKGNANIDIVSSPKVIENFNNDFRNFRYGVIPGRGPIGSATKGTAMKTNHFHHRARGVSLIDVMISVAVLATGMLAMAALQASLVRAGAESRTRSQAVAIAEGVLGALRSRTDANIATYRALTTVNWAATVNDATVTAPAAGAETFDVDATVDRFVLRTTAAACGAGNTPCFRAATVADAIGASLPEFKQVTVHVTWEDAGGGAHDISLVDVFSSLPSSNSELLVDRDLSGTPVNISGPQVRIKIPSDVGIIPIGFGDRRETAATNPKPLVDTRSGVPTTRFDVLTYRNESDSDAAQIQRRVENNVFACRCRFGPPTVTDATATFFTAPVRPTFWNGQRYTTPKFASDDSVTVPASWSAPDQAQSSLCDDCCRDHHDPAGATNKVSPLRTAHTHFGFNGDTVDLTASPVTSGDYAEACRMIRVDGIWRVAADFRLEQMGLLMTAPKDGRQAGDFAPDETAKQNYEAFAKQLINARANPPAAASPLTDTDIEALVQSNGLNLPTKILLTQSSEDVRFLHNRSFYFDYLEEPARNFIAAQIADCQEADPVLCVLPFVPITLLNSTELAAWGRSNDAKILVEGQAGLVDTFDVRRGTFVEQIPGGHVSPTEGGENQHPDGTQTRAVVGMSRSNRGVLALSFPGAGVNREDRDAALNDSQLFEYSSTATVDRDQDGVPDSIDNCATVANPDQTNTDAQLPSGGDAEGDACDIDDDDDGKADTGDSCPVTPDSNVDADRDGIDDACDRSQDMDGDTILDGDDNCPLVDNFDQQDTNGDGTGDACERDTDNDGVNDNQDNCVDVANPGQEDADNDGIGDACEVPVTTAVTYRVNVGITGENLALLSPKPRVLWTASGAPTACQVSVSPTDSDPNPFICDNAVAPVSTLILDQYNRVVSAGPSNAQVSNPCRSAPNGPAKVFPATCKNYALTTLTQNGTAVSLTGASVQNPGRTGLPVGELTESTSLPLSNLAEGDQLQATFTLESSTSLLGLGSGIGYTCSTATFEPDYIFTACPE